MKNALLCSSNPILAKSLHGILHDEGFHVATSEHPAFAVQMVIHGRYDFLIIDSEPFGLSAEDAAEIVRKIAPRVRILLLRKDGPAEASGGQAPTLDLEEFKRTIHGIAV